MSTLGRNIAFPIYKGNGSSFHDLVIRKSTSDSVVMSLGDKVTGDVYYKDNTLVCDMDEYILVDGVKYSIVNPPTIVREGLKSDNGDLKGMTKYSFEFYHPMYMLGNMAFSDVAVTNAESMFKSHDRAFSWIGNLTDFVAKLNKNLQDSQFVVSISSSIDTDSRKVLSDVLSFNDNTIADALKTAYDTWHYPFVVDAIKSGEQYYSQGKRFLIQFGNPTREILDSNNQPFVFHFGKGVGLKNNSRTSRNNKIVTRVAGYGSEQNIPYGYPQIPWTGDPSATQTADGYPIYEGIVGGVVTKLIKHPFTRTHLMPSVYVESVRKKVNSAASDYDNTTPLVDYYDAPSTYPNPINLDAPKLDIVGIDTIKPELGDAFIVNAIPINDDLTPASGWDDTMDDDGNYHQSYFKITLPQLDFDIYACASITEEMKINMRSGACIGCTFDAQVDWDDYKKNFFDAQGNFLPDGEQRDLSKYPKSNNGSIDLIVKKDLNTYGTLMPNVYQYPVQGDKFVILGISLPSTYITNAQERLDAALMAHMLDNNVYYYDYPLNFDEDFFYNHTDILSQVRPNSVLRFTFGDEEKSLYIKQITIKYGEGVLPKYDITLTDNIEVVLNQIGLVADDVSRLALAMMQMNKRTNINISNTESLQKYVDYTIMPNLESIQRQIDGSQVTYFGNEDPFDSAHPYSDGKYVVDPTKFPASEWDDDYSEHDGDMFYNRETGKGYEFTIIDNSASPVVYGWQLIQDEDIIQALNNAQTAQDTADGKRRVFICDASHHTPNPPYDVGDLWVNVKYPYSTGATYDDEILKCVVAKTEGQSFNINDWSLANGYTAALRNFINGTYADDLEDIQNQIDGKAETWYQSTDPSTAWTTTALKNQHKGDIWHNSSNTTINGVKAGQDAIWNGTSWVVDETVPQAVYDEIDGKCAIYVSWGAWGNDLQEKDLFIPAADTTQGGITYKANKVYRCVDKDTPLFQEIAYTDDTQYNGFITKLIGSSGQTKDAAENAIAAIKHALSDGNTYNEGGLILSNLISLGTGSPTSGTFTPWAGISGIYKTSETGTGYKGHGIAAWFGGGMIDKEMSAVSNAAKSLFRFDGSGYVAGGNLSWDKSGNVTIQGYSINATTLQVGGANVATQAMLNNYVSKAFFNRLFTAYDASGNAIEPNDTTTAISNLKLLVGTWTEQYLSALGLNSQGGGGGTGDVSHIKVSTNPDVYLDPESDGIIDMSDYVSTIAERNIWNTANANINRLMARVPSATFITGNELADKNFVNSSISTATATFRGTVTASNDTDAAAATALATISTKDLNDYAFVKVENTPQTGVDKYKRYKYNGTSWVYEYTLNNSSFTAAQWDAINSGITPTLVTKLNGIAAGAQVNVIESVKVNGTELSISSKAVDITAVPLTIITGADDLKAIEGLRETGFLKRTGNNTWALDTTVVLNTRTITAGNGLTGGGDLSENRTINVVSANAAITVNADNIKLNVINDYITTTNNTIIPLAAARGKDLNDRLAILEAMFTREGAGTAASPYVIKANYGLYTNQFLSSLGQNSQGGSGDFDEEQMWIALGTDVETKVVDSSHIPDIASKYGYATQTWVANNFNKYTLPLAASGTRGGVQIGFSESNSGTDSTRNYAVKLSSGEKMYVNVPWENTTYSAGTGISISSGTISNNGVRSITKHSTTAYDILLINTGGTIDYLDLSHQHSYWEILDKPTDLEGFGLTDELNALYVTALGTSGNYLTWTKNGSTSNITIPYATLANTATTAADTSNTLYLVGVTSEATTTLKRDTSISVKGSALNAGSVTTTGDVSVGGTLGVTGATTLTGLLTANGNIKTGTDNGAYIQIGAIKLVYDSTNNALKVIKSDNTSANLYATGAVSALGANSSGGGGGDFDEEQMWEALGTNTTTKVIATSHIPDMAGIYGYLKQSALSGYVTSVKVGTTAYNPSSGVVSLPAYPTKVSQLTNDSGYVTSSGVTSITLKAGTGISLDVDNTAITSTGTRTITNSGVRAATINGNYLRVNTNGTNADLTIPYATSAGSVAWGNVSGKPTTVSGYGITDAVFNISRQGDGILKYYVGSTANYLDLSHNHSYWDILDRPTDLEGFGLEDELNTNYVTIATNQTITGTKIFSAQVTANGMMLSTTKKIYFGDTSHYLELNSTGFHFSHGVYSDSFMSALGANSGGGGGSDFSEAEMWAALQGNTGTYANAKINVNHIPDTSSQYGYLKASSLSGYVTSVKVGTTAYNPSSGVVSLPAYPTTLPASDVYSWAKASTKPSYTLDEVSDGSTRKLANYLSLSGGTLTGSLKVATGYGISDATGNGLLVYKADTTWDGISSTQWGVGAGDVQGVIRSSNANLIHYKGGTNYTICDGSNTYVSSGVGYILGSAITTTTYLNHLSLVSGGTLNSTSGSFAWSSTSVIVSGNDNVGIQIGDSADKWQLTGDSHLYFRQNDSGGTNSTSWGNWLQILDTGNYSSYALPLSGGTITGNLAVSGSTTFSGTIVAKANAYNYSTDATSYGLNMNNSDLVGVNGIYTSDAADNWTEGINFKRTNGKWDSIRAYDGIFYFGHDSGTENTMILSQGANADNGLRIVGSQYGMMFGIGGGNVNRGIWGITSNKWLLYFNASNTYLNFGNVIASGDVTASSDERKKNIISDTKFNVSDIASARSVLYEWNDGRDKDNEKKIHGGSIAQDWLGKADSFLNQDNDGFYSINYGALALCSAITIAREVVKHSDEIDRLKQEVSYLKARIAELEERRVA